MVRRPSARWLRQKTIDGTAGFDKVIEATAAATDPTADVAKIAFHRRLLDRTFALGEEGREKASARSRCVGRVQRGREIAGKVERGAGARIVGTTGELDQPASLGDGAVGDVVTAEVDAPVLEIERRASVVPRGWVWCP